MAEVTVRLPALDWKVAITDPRSGVPTPYLQRFWQNMTVKVLVGDVDLSTKVSKGTSTGWGTPTGSASKATFATYVAPTISDPPTAAEVQAAVNHLQIISQHVAALQSALLSAEVIKA